MNTIPELREAFGYVLRNYRELAGFTQVGLAEKIGGAEITIRTLERGSSAPSLESFLLIAEALEKDPRDLLGEVLTRMAFLRESRK